MQLICTKYAGDAKEMSFAIDTEDDIRRFKKILRLMVENHTHYTGSRLYGLYREINTNDYPAITAYITNFNYGKYLSNPSTVCCVSATDFELIIIDDGSTDNRLKF